MRQFQGLSLCNRWFRFRRGGGGNALESVLGLWHGSAPEEEGGGEEGGGNGGRVNSSRRWRDPEMAPRRSSLNTAHTSTHTGSFHLCGLQNQMAPRA